MHGDLEGFAKIVNMVDALLALHQDVIFIDFHGLADLISEHLSDQPLICDSTIFQSKGHNFVTV